MNYKDEYIKLKKALSTLKRGKAPTIDELEILGMTTLEFSTANEYIVAHEFETKERIEFVKKLNASGVDLLSLYEIKELLDQTRDMLQESNNEYLLAIESVLGNLFYDIKD